MELTVNLEKKAVLQKAIERNEKKVRTNMMFSKIWLFIGILCGGCNVLLPCLWSGLSALDIVGSLLIFALFAIPSACFKAMAREIASTYNSARVNESLLIEDNKIRYSFRMKYLGKSSVNVITIDFSNISSLQFNEATGMLDFAGDILSEYFDDCRNKESADPDPAKLDEFMICDYFVPSLKDALQANGVKVNNQKNEKKRSGVA